MKNRLIYYQNKIVYYNSSEETTSFSQTKLDETTSFNHG